MNKGFEDEQGVIPAAISIADVLRGMAHRKFFVASMTAAAFAMSLGVVNVVKPVYTTETQILVADLETPFDKVQSVQGPTTQSAVSDRDLETQMAVIKSEDLGRRVVTALKLQEHPSFNPLIGGMGSVGKLKLKLGFGEDPRLKTAEQLALDAYNDSLTVYGIPLSNVIAIKVTAGGAKIAAEVANTLAETYVESTREATTLPNERARQWLAQQIDSLRLKVATSDSAVEQFRAQAGLFQGQTTTLGAQELSELNSQITQAEAAKTDARSRAESIRNLLSETGSVDASADVLAANVIQDLKKLQTEAQRNVAELSAVYLANHPKMIAAMKQLDSINRRIRTEALRIVEGLEEQAEIAEAGEESLRESLERAKGKATNSNLDDIKLKALEREAQANRLLLETMLARYAEATARLDPSAHPGFARVIQTASVPAVPSFPKKGPMVVLISMAGLSLGLGLAFLLELMAAATRLNERVFGTHLGDDDGEVAVPHVAAKEQPPPLPRPVQTQTTLQEPESPPPRIIASLPAMAGNSALPPAASIAQILAWFENQAASLATRSLGVTSLGINGPGSAILAVALGRTLAGRGKRVIVLDACAGSSDFAAISGASAGQGLSELVLGAADFTRVIVRDQQSTAHILRFGQDHSPRARAALIERLKPIVQALAQSYEVAIVHCGDATPETPALVRAAGAAVLLAAPDYMGDAAQAISVLRASGYGSAALVSIQQPAYPVVMPDFGRQAVNA